MTCVYFILFFVPRFFHLLHLKILMPSFLSTINLKHFSVLILVLVIFTLAFL